MPEGRRAPWKFLPRAGASLSVTFGEPLPAGVVSAALSVEQRMHVRGLWHDGNGDGKHQRSQVKREAGMDIEARIAVTELVQHAVEALGRQVSGDLLTGPPHQQPQQRT